MKLKSTQESQVVKIKIILEYSLPLLKLATAEHSMLAMLPMLEFSMMFELATMMLELPTMMTICTISPMTPMMGIWIMAIWIVAPMMRRTMCQVMNSIGGGRRSSTPS